MVLATVSDPHEASGTKQPSEVGPLHLPVKRLPRARRGASETSPCRRGGHSKRMARSPAGVTAGGRRRAEESPPPSLVAPAPSRIGSVRQRLARRAASGDHAAARGVQAPQG